MKMKLIKVKSANLLDLLKGKNGKTISNLPDDVELIKIEYNLLSGTILLIIDLCHLFNL